MIRAPLGFPYRHSHMHMRVSGLRQRGLARKSTSYLLLYTDPSLELFSACKPNLRL